MKHDYSTMFIHYFNIVLTLQTPSFFQPWRNLARFPHVKGHVRRFAKSIHHFFFFTRNTRLVKKLFSLVRLKKVYIFLVDFTSLKKPNPVINIVLESDFRQ